MPHTKLKKEARNAILLGGMCTISYFAVYIARNMLSSTSAEMMETGSFTEAQLGTLSSVYFITYAVGQLINGTIGDKIKAKYMISFGLILAGICNALFSFFVGSELAMCITYGMSGFFLSMIYGPMTKVVAENTELVYATRCSLGYTFASFLGTPAAGMIAVAVMWKTAFRITSVSLITMGIVALVGFAFLEKFGIVSDKPRFSTKETKGSVKVLIQRRIIKFTIISIITGVVRTAVVFWLPTYLVQYLGFHAKTATSIFTVCTFIISLTTFISVFIYERLNRNMDLAILCYFISATLFFALTLLIRQPVVNIICLILAIMSSGAAASMLWSRYCPSLHDTGMVSTATGFLDFISYMAAAASSSIFANAVSHIGWEGLILVWVGLMVVGVVVALPLKKQ